MSLATRFSRLFKADMHGLLDRLEEPDVIVRQALRDMEADVVRREALLASAQQDLVRQGQRRERLVKELAALEGQLAMCIGSGKDDLARSVIRRRLESERLLQAVTTRAADTEASIDLAHRELDECREKLASVRQKAEILSDRATIGGFDSERDGDAPQLTVTDDEVEIALLRAKQGQGAGS
jgi:phage shock protein A